ncbi:hypothetical protein EV189_2251 [Motilibacter rhizosphaerae]|uniref:Uncharacterized protein n=1 Tax=Motilibacter rhizosphaerae TaxID=598652 RepID=A0A4Q7NNM7_9ACTN|nr:hypothetical protein [Motilibacter rhizosphaerae]RZS86835.1 hypothetical protein EV189_2251 [Motilibacter rhizosphaerae]
MSYDPDLAAKTMSTAAWSALARTAEPASVLATWDGGLLREPRVLVPVDVQALVVSPGDAEPAVVVPSPLSPGAAEDATAVDGPAPFADGAARAPGVHLQWAAPDALLRGTLRDPRGSSGGGLGMPPLPDRWAVLRLVLGAKGGPAAVRGWLLDAATATVRDLAQGFTGTPLPDQLPARTLAPAELTGAAGGSPTWTGAYDASLGRLAWVDPLDDLAADPELGGALPGGPAGGSATYVVVGWWSDPALDPLDGVRTEGGLAERTAGLGWRVVEGGGTEHTHRQGPLDRLADLGVPVASRLERPVDAFRRAEPLALGARPPGAVLRSSTVSAFQSLGSAVFAQEATSWFTGIGAGVEASTLVHGAVLGVPLPVVGGAVAPDLRPASESLALALGEQVDDLVAASVAGPLGEDLDARRAVERLLTAFTTGLVRELSSPDGVADLDAREHAGGFAGIPSGEPPLVDRAKSGRASVPARPPRPSAGATPGRRPVLVLAQAKRAVSELVVESAAETIALTGGIVPPSRPAPAATVAGAEERVERPAPPRWLPIDPVAGVAGARRSRRHGGDGRADPSERLACRRASQVGTAYTGVVDGADLLPTLGSGALPQEMLALAREALLLSPHLVDRLSADGAAGMPGAEPAQVRRRLAAEVALRFTPEGGYVGGAGAYGATTARGDVDGLALQLLEQLRLHSLFDGVEPDLVALTSWAQPWLPLWLEWEVAVEVAPDLSGWTLGGVDLEPAAPLAGTPRVVSGRSPLTAAPGDALAGAVARWLQDEDARDRTDQGEADEATEAQLAALAGRVAGLDLVSASLDGVRTALLGLPRTALRPRGPDGTTALPAPVGPPDLLAGGAVTLTRLRVVDAFGRTLDVPLDSARVPARLAPPDGAPPATLVRPPRLQAPARCVLRLVDAAATSPAGAADAVVDEIDPAHQVDPVSGFLLPDHVDESVEVFAADGTPLGELLPEPTGGGVVWEPAPGRPLPADAPPSAGLPPGARALGMLAAGLVAADAAARRGLPAGDPGLPPDVTESALAAFLRAVDTTLWTVDPVAGAGSSGLGSITGRPVAVVRAVVGLEVQDDLAVLTLDDAGRAARAAAYAALAALRVRVRIGELTRSDDGVLGWWVDDDFSTFHPVDAAVRDLALEAGRRKGHLAPWGTAPVVPARQEILHPYLQGSELLELVPGVPRLVTLLLLPGARAHLTSGLLPRSSVGLSRAWFAPGLERLSPSVRVGPVLLDPGEVRLPRVAALGQDQVLTSREGALGWRDDAILAATQSALLPDRASVLREGWIRVAPEQAP